MIRLEHVTFTYANDEMPAISDVSLHVREGECVALLGASGCGKTTITRLLNGLVPEFYSGELYGDIYIDGKNTEHLYISDLSGFIGSVFQDPRSQFFATDTTAEVAFSCENAGLEQKEIVERIIGIAQSLEIEYLLERNIFQLSSGEKQMIAIASVCAYHPNILVFDEPSANLDLKATKKLEMMIKKLKQEGFTILLSEHRIHYIQKICDRAIYMKNGAIERILSAEELQKLDNENANMNGIRSPNLEKIQIQGDLEMADTREILKLQDVSFYYNKRTPVLQGLNLTAHAGQIIGVVGQNGAGKTTLLELICGLQKEKTGKIQMCEKPAKAKARQAYSYIVMQDSECQLFAESVEKELYLGNEKDTSIREQGMEILQRLNLSSYEKQHPASLSGGQKQRLCIAVSCMKDAPVICFDEPTSGLDYENMKQIAKLLREMAALGKVLVIVTHDFEFLAECCTHVFHMMSNGETDFFGVRERTVEEILDMMQ